MAIGAGQLRAVLPCDGYDWSDAAAGATVEPRWIRQQHHPTSPSYGDQFRNVTRDTLDVRRPLESQISDRRWAIGRSLVFRYPEMGKGWVIRSILPGSICDEEQGGSYGSRGQGQEQG